MDWSKPLDHLCYLHGEPKVSGDFRTFNEDFVVEEVLGFEPSGQGQHACLFIEKRGQNTQDVVRAIAELAKVRVRDVGFGGLKDRHAITRQWFTVDVGENSQIDFSALDNDSVQVLKQTRHGKKLRTGAHKANRFKLTIRNIFDMAVFNASIEAIKSQGVPNYFGEQRFGKGGSNLFLAERMFAGENIRDRKIRSLVISASRSWLFNLQVSARIKAGLFAKPLDGDILRLSGSRSFFTENVTDDIVQRLQDDDIQIAATLPGEGEIALDKAKAFERQAINAYQSWADGLAQLRVKADCRPVKLMAEHLQVQQLDEHTSQLSFELPVGSFATALLREAIKLTDCSKQES